MARRRNISVTADNKALADALTTEITIPAHIGLPECVIKVPTMREVARFWDSINKGRKKGDSVADEVIIAAIVASTGLPERKAEVLFQREAIAAAEGCEDAMVYRECLGYYGVTFNDDEDGAEEAQAEVAEVEPNFTEQVK